MSCLPRRYELLTVYPRRTIQRVRYQYHLFENLNACLQSQRWTPEAELVSKLKKLRTNKGPGHSRLAIKLLQEARSKGTTAIVAYNVIIRVSLLRLLPFTRGLKTWERSAVLRASLGLLSVSYSL